MQDGKRLKMYIDTQGRPTDAKMLQYIKALITIEEWYG